MKRIALGIIGLLLVIGSAAAPSASAAGMPVGTRASGMTYRPGVHLPMTHLPKIVPSNGAFDTENWSGYADEACGSCAFRYVAASFTLPSVNCSESPDGAYVSLWAGLDGITNGTVEQVGADGYCSGGAAGYYGWYEMYPLAPVVFSGVNPGDALDVNVYYNSATKDWQLGLTDVTTRSWVTAIVPCPGGSTCRNASAEVITEAPSSGGILPLADFGLSGYQEIQVTGRNGMHGSMQPNGLWITDAIAMVNGSGRNMASPGPAYAGQAFQVAWLAAN